MGLPRSGAGYSLAELLVSLAVVGCIMAGTFSILDVGLRAWRWGAARVEAQQSARVALERMLRELREAGYDPTGAGIGAVVVAEPTRVSFQRDLNGNGVVDPTHERVTYLLRPGENVLRRDAGGGAQPIIEGVRRLALTYFDRAGHETADPAATAAIRIELEVGLDASAVVVESQATLRNILTW